MGKEGFAWLIHTRQRWLWAVVLVLIAVVVTVTLALLPEAVRRIAEKRITAATGRSATIADVDLNLFTGQLRVKQFRLASPTEPAPFVEFDTFAINIGMLRLFTGRLRIEDAVLQRPVVRLARTGPATFNFSDLLTGSSGGGPPAAPLDVTIDGFKLADGEIVFQDYVVSPTQIWSANKLTLEAHHLSTNAGQPAGSAEIRFNLGSAPVALQLERVHLLPNNANITVDFHGFALESLLPYFPADQAIMLKSGRLAAKIVVNYGGKSPLNVDGGITVSDLLFLRHTQSEPFITAPELRVNITGLTSAQGTAMVKRAELSLSPSIIDASVSPPARFSLRDISVALEDATWPQDHPAKLMVKVDAPEGGRVEAHGLVKISPFVGDLQLALHDVPMSPYQPYLSAKVPLSGLLNADLTVKTGQDGGNAVIQGNASASQFSLGSRDEPMVSVKRASVSGIDLHWPTQVSIDTVEVTRPFVRVERQENGTFRLQELFGAPAKSKEETKSGEETIDKKETGFEKRIAKIAVSQGKLLFIDRTTSPKFSEQISDLMVNVSQLNTTGKPGRLRAQGLLSQGGKLELQGAIAVGPELYLDLDGELKNFEVPSTNPYLESLIAWAVKRGALSTKVHYRLEGDKLEATNDITIRQLNVSPAGENDEVKRRVGVPLGLLVALLKDVQGDIHLNLPVSGNLRSPQFSFADAIWTTIRNTVVRILSAPFRLIGRLVTGPENMIQGFDIDPIQFDAGTSQLAAGMDEQIRHVGEFLHSSPHIVLSMKAVISGDDVANLKIQEVVREAQTAQRKFGLDKMDTATTRLFVERFPKKEIPPTNAERIEALSKEEPTPFDAAQQLAQERVVVVRETLAKQGVKQEQLQATGETPPVNVSGKPRIEFLVSGPAE